jgi:hypothetical protein
MSVADVDGKKSRHNKFKYYQSLGLAATGCQPGDAICAVAEIAPAASNAEAVEYLRRDVAADGLLQREPGIDGAVFDLELCEHLAVEFVHILIRQRARAIGEVRACLTDVVRAVDDEDVRFALPVQAVGDAGEISDERGRISLSAEALDAEQVMRS